MNEEDEMTSFNKTFKIFTQMEKIKKQKEKSIDPSDIFTEVKKVKGKSYRKSTVDKKDSHRQTFFQSLFM